MRSLITLQSRTNYNNWQPYTTVRACIKANMQIAHVQLDFDRLQISLNSEITPSYIFRTTGYLLYVQSNCLRTYCIRYRNECDDLLVNLIYFSLENALKWLKASKPACRLILYPAHQTACLGLTASSPHVTLLSTANSSSKVLKQPPGIFQLIETA
jgi:hypothetical protein